MNKKQQVQNKFNTGSTELQQKKKHSPNTGEKSIFNMKCEHTDCSVCKSSPMLCSAHQHKDLSALYEGKETKPSQQEKCYKGHKNIEDAKDCDICLGYNYPKPPKSSDVELEQRFWLMWGLAPPSSLKYKKGVEVLGFIKDLLSQQQKRFEEMIGEDEQEEYSSRRHPPMIDWKAVERNKFRAELRKKLLSKKGGKQ